MALAAPANGIARVRIYGVQDTTWTEAGITWANAPSFNGGSVTSANASKSINNYQPCSALDSASAEWDGKIHFGVVKGLSPLAKRLRRIVLRTK